MGWKVIYQNQNKKKSLLSYISRRNLIAKLIDEWELCEIINDAQIDPVANMGQIKIISHKDKKDWELIPKYHIGK